MATLELNKEYIAPDESTYYDKVAAILIEQEKKKYAAGKVLRIFHAKMHGCIKAEFIVGDNVPDHLKVGLFKNPGSYPAFIRFSNSDDTVKPDTTKDVRGAAIKLMNVPGDKLMESTGITSTQDFVLFSTRNITPKNVVDNFNGIKSVYGGKLALLGFLMNPKHWYIVKDSMTKSTLCPNMLEIPFFSTTPYKYGDVGTVKYAMVPREPARSLMPETPSPTFLKERMVADLKVKEVWYDFQVQFQTDADKMPMEDTSVVWKSPFTTIASIKVPIQTFDEPAQFTFAENLVYNIWHTLPEHKPLGGLNRARKSVYDKLSAYRLERNGGVSQTFVDTFYVPKPTTLSVADPKLAQWVSAVQETITKNKFYFYSWHLLNKNEIHPMLKAAMDHVADVNDGKAISEHPETETDPGDPKLQITLSDLFFKLAEAMRTRDMHAVTELKGRQLKFARFDLVGWTLAVQTYLKNLKAGDSKPV